MAGAGGAKPETVDDYIAAFTEAHHREFLTRLRHLSRDLVPQATESLKWGNPAYSLDTILFAFAGYAKHANFVFTPSTKAAFADQLQDFDTGKGSIKLPYGQETPTELLAEMIAFRLREFEVDGVKWM